MAAIAIALTVWQHRAWRQEALSLPEYVAYVMASPLETVFSACFNRLHDAGLALAAAPRLAEENRRLREQVEELEAERILDVETRLQLKAISEKLGFQLDKPFDKLPARVISRSSGWGSRWVKIRAAGGKNLEVGNVVREAKGLVGRVVEAHCDVGRVVLLVDPDHAVRGRNLRTGDECMIHAAARLEAHADRLCFEKTRQGARVAVNDTIVTSDMGETYPGGIPIGVVEEVKGSQSGVTNFVAYVKPFVEFSRLDYVTVLRAGEQ